MLKINSTIQTEINSNNNFKEWEKRLRGILINNAGKSGVEYFNSTTKELGKILNADYTFIGTAAEPGFKRIKTISLCIHGEIKDNFEYDLADTPCENVLGKTVCSYKSNVANLFPKDILLKDMGVEAYLGVPLFDTHDKPLGIIVLLFKRAFEDTDFAEFMIQLIANKTAREIELLNTGESLKESQLQFQELFDNSPNSLWEEDFSKLKEILDHLRDDGISDFNGYFENNPSISTDIISKIKVNTVNDVTLTLFEAETKDEFLQNFQQILTEDSITFFVNCLLELLDGKTKGAGTCKAKTIKDKEITIEVNWVLPEHYKDSWEKVILSVQDISNRIKMEDQIRQSEKMSAIGNLAGGIAHDFNNILGAIMGYTELSLDDLTDKKKVKDNLQRVMSASNRAKEMVQQILAFSRKTELTMKSVNIEKIIEETIIFLRSSIPATIEIKFNIKKDLGLIFGNATQINQVLMNLCTNATYAMKDEGGTLQINLKEIAFDKDSSFIADIEPGLYQHLTVSDTGTGISKKIIDRIFDPYFTTKKDGEGTGMGLAVIYGIVKSHGGYINVYSELENGTVFNVYLPVLETIKNEDLKPDRQPSSTGKNERILFVDDEIALIEMGSQMLINLGYQVVSKTSSIEALQTFKSNPDKFDLILTDMTMPEMTGIKLIENIHKIKPEIPVVLCTGFSIGIDKNSYKRFGIDELIMKPMLKIELAEAIMRALNKRKQ